MNKKILALILALMLVVVLGNPILTTMAAQSEKGPATATVKASPEAMQKNVALWTKDARAGAKALASPKFTGKPAVSSAAPAGAAAAPAFSASGAPDPSAMEAARQSFSEEWAEIDASSAVDMSAAASDIEPTGTSGIYNTYLGNKFYPLYAYFPYYAVGKLYFRTWSGSSAYCSASVVSPNNIIVTAAHCVYDTDANKWQSGWVFVPDERNSVAPFGTFSYYSATVLTSWMSAPNYNAGIRYDVALIKLYANSVGQPVTYYTGWWGRSWNYPYVNAITEIGYPSNLGLGSVYTYVGHAETYTYSTDILGYGSNMGYGGSGSPLIRNYRPVQTLGNYVSGVQSGSSPNGTSPVFDVGPRFSSYNIVPLCSAVGC
jgi:V8-like Glu-specific endopeptidase